MKLPSWLIRYFLAKSEKDLELSYIPIALVAVFGSILTLIIIELFHLECRNITDLGSILSIMYVSEFVIALILFGKMPVSIRDIDITPLFKNQVIPRLNLRSIVQSSLSKEDYELLMNSSELIAKFRIKLYDILRLFSHECSKNHLLTSKDLEESIKRFVIKFADTEIKPYRLKLECRRKATLAKIHQRLASY